MTEGIIQQVFENWISCRPHITKTGMDELYSIEQELIERIREEIRDTEMFSALEDDGWTKGYNEHRLDILEKLIGDEKE